MKKGIKRQDSSPGWLLQAKRENESPKSQSPKLQTTSGVKQVNKPGLGRRTSSLSAFGFERLLKDASWHLDSEVFEGKGRPKCFSETNK